LSPAVSLNGNQQAENRRSIEQVGFGNELSYTLQARLIVASVLILSETRMHAENGIELDRRGAHHDAHGARCVRNHQPHHDLLRLVPVRASVNDPEQVSLRTMTLDVCVLKERSAMRLAQ
jgi:hypothetical protein